MSMSVCLTGAILLNPEAAACWKEVTMTDIIDSVVGRRRRRRK